MTTTCARVRASIQDRLDGPLLADRAHGIEAVEAIEEHVGACPACREYQDELRGVLAALRDLPAVPFPDPALEEVWRLTSRAPRRRFAIRVDWRIAAAAAIVTIALLPSLIRPISKPPSPIETARAWGEARLVLGLAGRAIRDSERARDQILSEEISRAFRHVPIRSSSRELDDTRRPRS